MGNTGLAKWQTNANKYTNQQVEAVLRGIGVDVVSETYSDYLCHCPFHGSANTPSFTVGVNNGLYMCFNGACGESGTLTELVRKLTQRNEYEAMRFIAKRAGEVQDESAKAHSLLTAQPEEWVEWDQKKLDALVEQFWPDSPGRQYMNGRGFSDDTLRTFDVGYSTAKRMVTVPVHSPTGMPVGLVGRSLVDKRFQNSKKLPRHKTLFNLHRAKKWGGIGIVCEASFDAMRIHQAGYPNVVAFLGGSLSAENFALLDRHFTTIILFTDFDDLQFPPNCPKCRQLEACVGHNPGRDTGMKLIDTLRSKNFLWASYGDRMVYPHGAKDAGDLEDEEIAQCIKNAVPHLEYSTWGLY